MPVNRHQRQPGIVVDDVRSVNTEGDATIGGGGIVDENIAIT